MREPFVVAVTCVRRRPWAAKLWVEAMAAQTRRPDAVLVVVDEPDEEDWYSWGKAIDELERLDARPVPFRQWLVERYPRPSAPGWSRGTRESGWREPEPGASGRYSDDQHAHLAALRNWTVERALELWPQASHIGCCDSDVAAEPDVLELLLAADKEVVAAVVRNGERAWNFMLVRDEHGEPRRIGNEEEILLLDTPFRVTMTGACALYRREVFEPGVWRDSSPPAFTAETPQGSHAAWRVGKRGGAYYTREDAERAAGNLGLRWGAHPRGEDVAFAIQARKLGVSLWVEPRAGTLHRMAGPDKEPLS